MNSGKVMEPGACKKLGEVISKEITESLKKKGFGISAVEVEMGADRLNVSLNLKEK